LTSEEEDSASSNYMGEEELQNILQKSPLMNGLTLTKQDLNNYLEEFKD